MTKPVIMAQQKPTYLYIEIFNFFFLERTEYIMYEAFIYYARLTYCLWILITITFISPTELTVLTLVIPK